MKIYGFQKLTLLDFPERLAAIVFTGGCNFRCPWCQNGELTAPAADPALSEADVMRQLERRASMLEGVVISGGEPTLQPDLREFVLRCRGLGYKIKLDTNGSRPDVWIPLAEEGLLDYVAMDIKADKEKYREACGLPDIDMQAVAKSVNYLLSRCSRNAASSAGRPDDFHYEFRTTVIPEIHDSDSIARIAARIAGAERYYLQAYRDSESVLERRFTEPDADYMNKMLAAARKFVPHAELRGL